MKNKIKAAFPLLVLVLTAVAVLAPALSRADDPEISYTCDVDTDASAAR